MKRVAKLVLPLIPCFVALMPSTALGQAYPTKPLRIIDPWAPGGSTEAQARMVGQQLAILWNQPVIVDARPGAGSAIGSQIVAKSTPDGYTLLLGNAAIPTLPKLAKKAPFDPIRDFAPIIRLGTQPQILVVHPSLPGNLKDVLEMARNNPGKLNFASAGNGALSHLSMELLKMTAKVNIVHVPYKGSTPASTALIAGEVQMGTYSANAILPHIRAGRLRTVGVTTDRRSVALPDVPTISEAGLPGFNVMQWSGLFAPAGTPQSVVTKLNQEINDILMKPDIKERLVRIGVEPSGGSPAEFSTFIAEEVKKWANVIDKANISLN